MSEQQWAVQSRPNPAASWQIVGRGFGGPRKSEAGTRARYNEVRQLATEEQTFVSGHEVRLVSRTLPDWEESA